MNFFSLKDGGTPERGLFASISWNDCFPVWNHFLTCRNYFQGILPFSVWGVIAIFFSSREEDYTRGGNTLRGLYTRLYVLHVTYLCNCSGSITPMLHNWCSESYKIWKSQWSESTLFMFCIIRLGFVSIKIWYW